MPRTCELCDEKTGKMWKRCDEHYRCDDCRSRKDLCTYTEGVLCEECHQGRVDARIAAFNGETQYTSEAVCPHCGYVMSDCSEMSEGPRQCCDCGNDFELTRDVEVTYSTKQVVST